MQVAPMAALVVKITSAAHRFARLVVAMIVDRVIAIPAKRATLCFGVTAKAVQDLRLAKPPEVNVKLPPVTRQKFGMLVALIAGRALSTCPTVLLVPRITNAHPAVAACFLTVLRA